MKSVEFLEGKLRLKKELSELDRFVLEGTPIISRVFKRYVIVAGYVAILFGRSRVTEDIDVIIDPEAVTIENVIKFYEELNASSFWIFNAFSPSSGFEILREGLALRVAKKPNVIPNFEIKKARKQLEYEALRNRIKVALNEGEIYISPIELNIAYKLYLGSQKDVEDAVYLYCIFQEKIRYNLIINYLRSLGVKLEELGDILRC